MERDRVALDQRTPTVADARAPSGAQLHDHVLVLQQTAGNGAVVALLRQRRRGTPRAAPRPPSTPPARAWHPIPPTFREPPEQNPAPLRAPLNMFGNPASGEPVTGWPAAASTPEDRRWQAYLAFRARNLARTSDLTANISEAQMQTIYGAVTRVLSDNLPLQTALLNHYGGHNLRLARPDELQTYLWSHGNFDALTDRWGTTLHPRVLGYPEGELVAKLLHEMDHGHHQQSFTATQTGAPEQEGEAWALEYIVAERAGDSTGRLRFIRDNMRLGLGEVNPALAPQLVAAFNRAYAGLSALYRIVDGTFVEPDAPFNRPPMTPDEARGLIAEMASGTRSARLQEVLRWAGENQSRFHPPGHM